MERQSLQSGIPLLQNLVIIITTRNRISELLLTIDSCIGLGVTQKQIFVTDDASTDSTPSILAEKFPAIRIRANKSQLGYIHNRNYMMEHSDEDFILSLDDDSNLLSREDLEEALLLLSSREDYGVLGFTPYEQLERPPLKETLSTGFFLAQTYIGCGHIIKRTTFNVIGKYREEFIFYGEEHDFSIRCFKAGLYVVQKRNLVIHHRIDIKARAIQLVADNNRGEYSRTWRTELLMTNRLTRIFIYHPAILIPYYFLKTMTGYFYLCFIKYKWSSSYGKACKRMLKRMSYVRKERDPLTLRQFRLFSNLETHKSSI